MSRRKSLPVIRPEGQPDIFSFGTKESDVERIRIAQDKMLAQLGITSPEIKLETHSLENVARRARREAPPQKFEEKAAELYAQSFLVMNGYGMWFDRRELIREKFLAALKDSA